MGIFVCPETGPCYGFHWFTSVAWWCLHHSASINNLQSYLYDKIYFSWHYFITRMNTLAGLTIILIFEVQTFLHEWYLASKEQQNMLGNSLDKKPNTERCRFRWAKSSKCIKVIITDNFESTKPPTHDLPLSSWLLPRNPVCCHQGLPELDCIPRPALKMHQLLI